MQRKYSDEHPEKKNSNELCVLPKLCGEKKQHPKDARTLNTPW
jgi:hypothetical protein